MSNKCEIKRVALLLHAVVKDGDGKLSFTPFRYKGERDICIEHQDIGKPDISRLTIENLGKYFYGLTIGECPESRPISS